VWLRISKAADALRRTRSSTSDAVAFGGIVGDRPAQVALAALPVRLLPGRHADRVAVLDRHPVPAAAEEGGSGMKDKEAAVKALNVAGHMAHIFAVHAIYCPTCQKDPPRARARNDDVKH